MTLRLVVIESPYAGDVDRNLRYLRACMADCLRRGEAPYASHALYTQPGVLDDTVPEERTLGIEAGFAWAAKADACVFYTDLGWSRGMLAARERHGGRRVEERRLGGEWSESRLRVGGDGDAPIGPGPCPSGLSGPCEIDDGEG